MKNCILDYLTVPRTWHEIEQHVGRFHFIQGHCQLGDETGVFWDGINFTAYRAIRDLITEGEAEIIKCDLQVYLDQEARHPRGFVPTQLVRS